MDLSLTGFVNRQSPEIARQVREDRGFANLPSPMLAKKGHPEMLNNPDLTAETKFDGNRILLVKRDDVVRIFTMGRGSGRQNEYTHRYPLLIADGKKLNCTDCILDGEFVFYDARGNEGFLTIGATDATIGSRKYKYMAFDILEKDGQRVMNLPIEERKRILDDVVPNNLTIIRETKVIKSNKRAFFERMLAEGREGVMLKRKGSLYNPGARSSDWLKIKRVDTIDVIAKGGTRGTGARAPYFGALKCYVPDGRGGFRHIGNVGSGFKDRDLREITPMMRSNRPFVVELKIMEWTTDRKMRFPVFVRLRPDKSINEVSI
jgi:bifunctional non-homologous end joining protein LigD